MYRPLRGQARSYTGSAPYAWVAGRRVRQQAGSYSDHVRRAQSVSARPASSKQVGRATPTSSQAKTTCRSALAREPRWVRQTRVATTTRRNAWRERGFGGTGCNRDEHYLWDRLQPGRGLYAHRQCGAKRGFGGTGFSREGDFMRTVNFAGSIMPSSRLKPVPQWITAADVPAPSRASALLHRVCAIRALGG
jgi:hypothetical protein